MVSVAQLVERWIVAPVVVGSIPITHPKFNNLGTVAHVMRLFTGGVDGTVRASQSARERPLHIAWVASRARSAARYLPTP